MDLNQYITTTKMVVDDNVYIKIRFRGNPNILLFGRVRDGRLEFVSSSEEQMLRERFGISVADWDYRKYDKKKKFIFLGCFGIFVDVALVLQILLYAHIILPDSISLLNPTSEYILSAPYRYVMFNEDNETKERCKDVIERNLVLLEKRYSMIDFKPFYNKLETMEIVFSPLKETGYSKEDNVMNFSSVSNSLKSSDEQSIFLGELTLDFFVQNFRGYVDGFDETKEILGARKLFSTYLYGTLDSSKRIILFENFDINSLLSNYIFGDKDGFILTLSYNDYGDDVYTILSDLGQLKQLSIGEEGEQFFENLREKNYFIIDEITKDNPYYQEVLSNFDAVLHQKLGSLGISTSNFDKRKENLEMYLFDSYKYGRGGTVGIAHYQQNRILLSNRHYMDDLSIAYHELSHIASFDQSITSMIGPFVSVNRLLENYSVFICNWLCNDTLGTFDDSYQDVYGSAHLACFLSDPYKFVKAYFENDEELFLESFDERVILREDLLFLLEVLYNNQEYLDEDLDRCYQILLDSFVKRVVYLDADGVRNVSLEEYALYFNNCMLALREEGIGSRLWNPLDVKEKLEKAFGVNISGYTQVPLAHQDYCYYMNLLDPYGSLEIEKNKVYMKE